MNTFKQIEEDFNKNDEELILENDPEKKEFLEKYINDQVYDEELKVILDNDPVFNYSEYADEFWEDLSPKKSDTI